MPSLAERGNFSVLKEDAQKLKGTHLRQLLADEGRNQSLVAGFNGIILDYCREKVTKGTMDKLFQLADQAKLKEKIRAMFEGEHLNNTEDRSVMHMALRAKPDQKFNVDGKNVVPDVHQVLTRIKRFASQVRNGEWVGHTGKVLKDVICIGIGGSYLGPECVFEALRTDGEAAAAAQGRRLKFLANVDPIDVKRALEGFHPETTLCIVISKTFTTAETMLNARTVREWFLKSLQQEAAISRHMVAVSTNLAETNAFGINPDNVFGFWDWVGGRFSVCSAVGVLPLAIQYGYTIVQKFLDGCNAMDNHFASAPLNQNLPALLGLLGVWNASFMGYEGNAILPYCQALHRFAAHVQQVNMESNGKRVTTDGQEVSYATSPVVFGEPGTNGQHSFYQLLHQGRTVPCEFIGFCNSQNPVYVANEPVPNHDELMCNFFAQPDALAYGKTPEELQQEGVKSHLISHRTFPGDRPSLSLLLPVCDAWNVGAVLALYEHRTAVEGFMWEINSFDQWGVELGKVLAKEVRTYVSKKRKGQNPDEDRLPLPTRRLLKAYLAKGSA